MKLTKQDYKELFEWSLFSTVNFGIAIMGLLLK